MVALTVAAPLVGSIVRGRHADAPFYAPGRIRTCGLALRRRALYPLSYGRSGF